MSFVKMFKKVVFPCAAGIAVSGHSGSSDCCDQGNTKSKPSDLPLYPKECATCRKTSVAATPSNLEQNIGQIRKEIWVWQDSVVGYRHKLVDVINNGLSSTSSIVDYLRVESNGPQRYGAVALGGLTGLILSLRGGFFRRLLYPTVGAASMAAVCYPSEAAEYTDEVVEEGKKYFVVAYHFVVGEAPKTPEWLSNLGFGITANDEDSPKKK